MKFIIGNIDDLNISDKEISELLYLVYVEGGFTSADMAKKVFEPNSVKDRGFVLGAREEESNEFSGMIIIVPPASSAIVRAKENECEIHLLGVKPKFRHCGLGRDLVSNAVEFSETNKWSKIILWTQKSMKSAQTLYETFDFKQTDEMSKNDIEFLVFEKKNT